jgi:hypothetical protein
MKFLQIQTSNKILGIINLLNFETMKNKLFIYLTFIGLIGLLFSCEKDETKVIMSASPAAPTITTMPDLTLQRTKGSNLLEFVGTAVNPGFAASANYFLEACATGTKFADPIILVSGIQATSLKLTVSDMNGMLIKKFPTDKATSLDFRLRAVLVADAGTGATPFVYSSDIKTASVTTYGLPRLDLVNSGINQKIESALGDGKYFGFVKLDKTKAFTLKDPDANIVYGSNGIKLAVSGTGISSTDTGWFKFSADTKALTFSMEPYMIGLIGSATPNGWNAPDSKMDYDAQTGLWNITLNLTVGAVKIRYNDSWGAINLGLGDATHPGYSLSNLWNDGGSKDIPITEAGNYTIKVYIGTTYSITITKN